MESFFMVGRSGLEPPTSRLSGVRSNHLSYKPLSQYLREILPLFFFQESLRTLRIKQLNFHSLYQTFDVSAAIAAP